MTLLYMCYIGNHREKMTELYPHSTHSHTEFSAVYPMSYCCRERRLFSLVILVSRRGSAAAAMSNVGFRDDGYIPPEIRN